MHPSITHWSLSLAALSLIAACGGGAKPAETPASATKQTDTPAASSAAPAKPAEPAASGSEAATAGGDKKPEDSGPKPSRSPIDTISAPKLAFVINYGSSAPNEAADKKCGSAKDPKAKSLCMQKERGEFKADVLQFKKDAKEKLWWIIYRRKGSTLTELSRSEIQMTETANTVTVKIVGKDKKPHQLFAGKDKFVVSVPNDYSIELDDPQYGKLVYDAKIDIVDQAQSE